MKALSDGINTVMLITYTSYLTIKATGTIGRKNSNFPYYYNDT